MVQAIPAIGAAVTAAGAGSALALAVAVVNTVLINITLGAIEYRDAAGDRWTAIDE